MSFNQLITVAYLLREKRRVGERGGNTKHFFLLSQQFIIYNLTVKHYLNEVIYIYILTKKKYEKWQLILCLMELTISLCE